jgi:hypothetical protein
MAAVPVALSAVYDDSTSTLTLSASLPPPGPPAGVDPDQFYVMAAPSVSVDVKVSRKTPMTNGYAFYLTSDANHVTHKWRVDYNATTSTWNMPGVEVPYP